MKISTLEDILKNIKIEEENLSLDFIKQFKIQHPVSVSVGDEHEGVAKKLFDRALPGELACESKTFVKFKNDCISHQVDLIVTSNNKKIKFPNSDSYIVESQDVVAAFEIKKTLTKNNLIKDIKKLSQLKENMIIELSDNELLNNYSMTYADELFKKTVVSGLEINGRKYSSGIRTPLMDNLYGQFSVQAYMPFTACFGFGSNMSKESFIEAFIESVAGLKPSSWPDIVTCNNMSIVKLDGRPYNSPYFYFGDEKVTDICISYAFFEPLSLVPYIEHLWEKMNTNIYLNKIFHIESDTTESFFPVLVSATLPHKNNEVVLMRMDSSISMDYSDEGKVSKMFLEVLELDH